MPTALDNGQRSPRKLLRALIARLLGRFPVGHFRAAVVSRQEGDEIVRSPGLAQPQANCHECISRRAGLPGSGAAAWPRLP
jgi:hypothetical protein